MVDISIANNFYLGEFAKITNLKADYRQITI